MDCGGVCDPCADFAACERPEDCLGSVCTGGTCQPPACDDGVQNGSETGLDCGGGCPSLCTVIASIEAPETGATVPRDIAEAVAFLYSGTNPVQVDVEEEALDPGRTAALNGRVQDIQGTAMAGVEVAVLGHPEFGHTSTREDGEFDMVVNGGDRLVLTFQKDGFLPAQRHVRTRWRTFVRVADVTLVAYAAQATEIDFSEPMQVARGEVNSDEAGERQATLLFPQGTEASMLLETEDGLEEIPLETIHVRVTEYTVGENGPSAMPAMLPPTSGYTYAVEISVDEAVSAGAASVSLSAPMVFYVDNYLGFPTGTRVPLGSYDASRATWVPEEDGSVVEVLAETGGMAVLDVDGTGQPAGQEALDTLGVTEAELSRIAELYDPGDTLWRVLIDHFTPWDLNWPYGPPPGAERPSTGQPLHPRDEDDPCEETGSIIECQNQVLGQELAVVGTPFTLHYQSDRVPGRTSAYTAWIPLTGESLPPELLRIDLQVEVAGQIFYGSFPPTPDQAYTFVWDGLDRYGREVSGIEPLAVTIGYVYPVQYYASRPDLERSFAAYPSEAVIGSRSDGTVTLQRTWYDETGTPFLAKDLGLGGWVLNVQHVYDPTWQALYEGNGTRYHPGETFGMVARTVAGNGWRGTSGDGGQALDATFLYPSGLSSDGAGNLYITDVEACTVRRVDTAGIITTVAGNPDYRGYAPNQDVEDYPGMYGEGGPATEAWLANPEGVTVDGEGNLYIADTGHGTIRKVDRNGLIRTVAGIPNLGGQLCEQCVDPCLLPSGDPKPDCATDRGQGALAVEIELDRPVSVAIDDQGGMVFSDAGRGLVWRVDVDGFATTIAGTEQGGSSEDGILATTVRLIEPWGVAIDAHGAVYVADRQDHRVRRVGTDGIMSTVAGTGEPGTWGDGGPAVEAALEYPESLSLDQEGGLYIGDVGPQIIRKVDTSGVILRIAGVEQSSPWGRPVPQAPITNCDEDNFPARQTCIGQVAGLAAGADGSLYYVDTNGYKVRKITSPLPGFQQQDYLIPSPDGDKVYHFSDKGRHLETIDALTGDPLYTFQYDEQGLLVTVVDRNGQETTIERDSSGAPLAIVSPFGLSTNLTPAEDGYLAAYTDPSGRRYTFTYSNGLMTSMTDPEGNTYTYTYDTDGRLIQDTDPTGATQTLAQTDISDAISEVAVTSPEGLTTTYRTERDTDPLQRTRTMTMPTGAVLEAVRDGDNTEILTAPDGTTAEKHFGSDPRWGMAAPFVANRTVRTPDGLNNFLVRTREAYLFDYDNPLSLNVLWERVEVNDRRFEATFDRTSRTYELVTAEGRTRSITFDSAGHVSEFTFDPDFTPLSYAYDDDGRLIEIRQGPMSWAFTYDSRSWLAYQTDAAGYTVTFEHDDAGHLLRSILPSGLEYRFVYDANGNRTQLIMPSGAVHETTYTPIGLEASYTPPSEGAHETHYNRDRQIVRLLLPSGASVDSTFDDSGRISSTDYDGGSIVFEYDDGTERVHRLLRVEDGSETTAMTFGYDGHIVTRVDIDTSTRDTFVYEYDDNFFLVGLQLDSLPWIPLPRDEDGLLVGVGPFSIDRNGPSGAPSSLTGEGMVQDYFYDDLGRFEGNTLRVAGAPIYELQVAHDDTGRIVSRVETLGGVMRTLDYVYDPDGQLLEVRDGDTVVEAYAYDENGNRVSRQRGDDPAEAAEFDSADRLLARGDLTYTYDADGFMTTRGDDSFTYTRQGELIRADLADGRTVSYTYDGLGRRVTRTGPEGTTTYLYGNPGKPAQVTAVRDPSGTLTFYYYDEEDRLFAFQRGSDWYFVGADQVSSPLVVADADGNIVKRIDRDAFGAVLADTNPDFVLHIGFAGGLLDPDTGLLRFGFRDYDPEAGRWTARDPIRFAGAQANLFVYVGNSPVTLRDPMGLICLGGSWFMGIGGGATLCIDKSGVSVCGEVGVGMGQSVSYNAFGKPGETEVYYSAEVAFRAGALTVGVSGTRSYSDCKWSGDVTLFAVAGIGAATAGGTYSVSENKYNAIWGVAGDYGDRGSMGVESSTGTYGITAKAAVGGCYGTTF